MKNFKALDWVMLVLLAVGGLNWGLVGVFDFDLVAAIFGEGSALARIVYTIVGIAAVYSLAILPRKSSSVAQVAPSRQTS